MNKSKISKELILTTAYNSMIQENIHHLNIRDIAFECGVSIGSIYNYFPTKSALIVALIEKFWETAFQHDDFYHLLSDTFVDSYIQLYHTLFEKLQPFKSNWLVQLSLLDEETKELGRKIESDYFLQIKKMLGIMIDKDQFLHSNIWTKKFSKESFINFVFQNTMDELKKGNSQPDFLVEIFKRILK